VILPDWPAPSAVKAVSTTRVGGVSQRPYDAFNLADHVGDSSQAVQRNRAILRERLMLPSEPLWLDQVHEDSVVSCDGAAFRPQADAALSDAAGSVCVVLTADCLPVLFCDRKGTRVAAAHAGWRGLAAGILERCVEALDLPPEQVLAWLGPAIGPRAFEVGSEVRDAFTAAHAEARQAFARNSAGRWFADLYHLARIRLAAVGVTAVYGGGLCTFTDQKRFYSYRRDGTTGRMASLIWLA
jgi:hypothetical protein